MSSVPPRDSTGTDGADAAPSVDEALASTEGEADSLATIGTDALTDEAALEVTTHARTTVVVPAGGVGVGKTTLLAALYERFGRGPVADLYYAGSRTLGGFESRCAEGRTDSGRRVVFTEHTSRTAPPWLHLRLHSQTTLSNQDFLLGDFNGEYFDELSAGVTPPSDLPFLQRADHVCLVVDGEQLADPFRRAAERQRAADLLAALLRPGVLVDLAALTMVVTKWDMVLLADANHAKAVEETLAWLQERFAAARVGEAMAIVEVAARSTIRELPLGHGLNELLGLWSQRPATDPATPTVASLSRIPHSSYDLFRARRFEYYG